jgi:hypothetical protein
MLAGGVLDVPAGGFTTGVLRIGVGVGLVRTGVGAGVFLIGVGAGMFLIGVGVGLVRTGVGAGLARTGVGAGMFLIGAGAGLLLTAAGAGALLTGGGGVFSFWSAAMPDEANSTATSAAPRQPARSAFTIRRALIEFSSCWDGSKCEPLKPAHSIFDTFPLMNVIFMFA